jgi:hypothetical protein
MGKIWGFLKGFPRMGKSPLFFLWQAKTNPLLKFCSSKNSYAAKVTGQKD